MDETEMTWAQFKAYVESKGVTDDMEINFIDVSLCSPRVPPTVQIGDNHFSVQD